MAKVSAYWRPDSVQDAVTLATRPGAVVIGGGTKVNAVPTPEPVEVVDLQALGLGRIERFGPDTVMVGATATLQEIADSATVPVALRDAARRERPSTLRAQATIAGTVMTRESGSELLATLLVHGALLQVVGLEGAAEIPLHRFLSQPSLLAGRIVTGVVLEANGTTSSARTARTPADRPIVAAVARRDRRGRRWLALTGVAATPVLVDRFEDVDPPGDFRGSKEYRRALAATLAARVLEAIR